MDLKFQLQVGIVLAFCLYGIIFTMYQNRKTIQSGVPQTDYRYYYNKITNISTMRLRGHVEEYQRNTTLPQPTFLSRFNATESNKSCLWKVQFWDSLYKLQLRQGFYYCPETDCTVEFRVKSRYDAMKTSHVVVLHPMGDWDIDKIKSFRRADQVLVYMSWESPPHSGKSTDMSPFNWTMTYHSRADIPIPYASLVVGNSSTERWDASEQAKSRNWAQGKTGLAIWIAHNCHWTTWPRTDYIQKLSTFVKIDSFGLCGNYTCPDVRNQEGCLRKINSYKFYIAFENSQCEDYITEKMWRNAFKHNAVPIVYGAPKSDYERVAPKNSFIHISDFSNMSSLASYIELLDKNDALYNKFFEWRFDYHVEHWSITEAVKPATMCTISKRLANLKSSHNDNTGVTKWFDKSCNETPRPDIR